MISDRDEYIEEIDRRAEMHRVHVQMVRIWLAYAKRAAQLGLERANMRKLVDEITRPTRC